MIGTPTNLQPALAERIVVLAPADGQAGGVAQSLARGGGGDLAVHGCHDLAGLAAALKQGAGAVVVVQEALTPEVVGRLRSIGSLERRGPELPIIILGDAEGLDAAGEALAGAGATLLERPVTDRTLVSVLQLAMRGQRGPEPLRPPASEQDRNDRAAAYERTALRASEAHLRDVLDSLPAFIAVLDPAGVVLQVNRAVLESSKLSAEDLVGRELADVDWFSGAQEAQAALRSAVRRAAAGDIIRYDSTVLGEHGGPVAMDITLAPMFSEAGEVAYIIAGALDITARKQAEEATKQREWHYRQLAEALPQLVWTCTPEGLCDYLSRQWCEYTGRPEQEQLGSGWSAALHPDDRARAREAWYAAQRGEAPYDLEYRIRRADGQYRWFQTRGVPIRDAGGEVFKWFGTCTDIHDRRQMEEQLRASEERYRLVVRATSDIVWDWDLVTDNIVWGEALTARVGHEVPAGGTSSQWWRDMVHADDRARVTQHLEEVIGGGGEHWTDEYRFRRADGLYAHILDRGYVMRDQAGRAVRMIGAMLDLTDRKRAEEDLRASESRFRQLAESMPQIVWTASAEGEFEYFCSRWYQQTGLDHCTMDEAAWRQVLHPDDADAQLRAWNESLRSGREFNREYRLRDREPGRYRWHLVRAVPIRDEQGRITRWFGTSTDIDDLKRAQQRLAVTVEELNRSNRELEDFAHIASHDLKEPLRGIRNYASFLLEDFGHVLGADGRRKLATIDRLCTRMDDLIRSLLYYSQVGRTEMAIADTDLNQIVLEVLESLGPTLSERGADIRIPRPLPTVRCDRVRIAEIYRNLITNAIKYNDKPEPWVEISWRPPPHPGGQPVLYIRDNGIGIPAQHHATVFVIFRRLHGRDEFGGGTGSGLAFVKRIVERHGGRIWVESTPGEGTTFLFTLGRDAYAASEAADPDS